LRSSEGTRDAARTSGAYGRVRVQFKTPIGRFEGVEEALSRIGGNTYMMNAARVMTAGAVDLGEKPSGENARGFFAEADAHDVRYWPLADIASCTAHVCFRGKADIDGECSQRACHVGSRTDCSFGCEKDVAAAFTAVTLLFQG